MYGGRICNPHIDGTVSLARCVLSEDCIYGHHTYSLHENCSNERGLTHFIVNKTMPNPLAPNGVHISRTAQLTSRRCILNIYSTNILTEYFKHAAHSPFFFSSRCRLFHNAIFFGSCNIHILNTGCAKILKKIPAPKG